jgi:hypothetical protein
LLVHHLWLFIVIFTPFPAIVGEYFVIFTSCCVLIPLRPRSVVENVPRYAVPRTILLKFVRNRRFLRSSLAVTMKNINDRRPVPERIAGLLDHVI